MKILQREVKCSWLSIAIYLGLMAALCSLGFWQLNRAEQKKAFLAQQRAAISAAVLDLNQQALGADISTYRYQNIQVSGHYDDAHQFLLDNQMMEGKPGYMVLSPFLIDGEQRAVLVNRGWLPLGINRQTLPDISIHSPVMHILGRINQFPGVGIKLAGAEIPTAGWPAVVQVINSQILAAKLSYDLYDFQIELDAKETEGYKRQWQISTTIPPEKHQAYAVQWFGLALTLTALFFWITIRKTQ
ncbi:SURF1 family protein [Methylomonas paludis]|uniref:SURF1-like protein n=1 Tax=Methylomonas paludis TaxID=1173101 RepID=A0A975R8V0_9GAMM|nr:SURF1 family protein [Methylomonas paludis]QWF70412.1 SURF1 family protein [Methylomonas paludis]